MENAAGVAWDGAAGMLLDDLNKFGLDVDSPGLLAGRNLITLVTWCRKYSH